MDPVEFYNKCVQDRDEQKRKADEARRQFQQQVTALHDAIGKIPLKSTIRVAVIKTLAGIELTAEERLDLMRIVSELTFSHPSADCIPEFFTQS